MGREVTFLDLRATYLEIKDELDAAYQRVMNSGWYILGEEVTAFEREFAEYCGTKHCVGVANGLEALQLILRSYGIGAGDEVRVSEIEPLGSVASFEHAEAFVAERQSHELPRQWVVFDHENGFGSHDGAGPFARSER